MLNKVYTFILLNQFFLFNLSTQNSIDIPQKITLLVGLNNEIGTNENNPIYKSIQVNTNLKI